MNTSVTRKTGTTPATREEVRALIDLLEDPDPFVRQKVEERLSELDESSVPVLDEYREWTSDAGIRARITELIHNLTYRSFEIEFVEFLTGGVDTLADLERGQLMLCRLDNPTLRTDLYRRQLDRLAARLAPSIHPAHTPGEQVQTFVSFFFEQEYFRGAESDYMSPSNSFLHKVLQRRTGIPISLSMVLLFVARRLDLPFFGVNMPMHFLIKHGTENRFTFIDPFNRGRVVRVDQCSYFLRNHGIQPLPAHFEKATPRDMLSRSVRNLINSFEREKRPDRAEELKRLLGFITQTVKE